jgi:twinkle protein
MKGVRLGTVLEHLINATDFKPANLINSADVEKDLIEKIKHPDKFYGISTPWDDLTKILRGWRERELTIWTGNSGAGKSSILNEVVINLLRKKQKYVIVMASMEMAPTSYLRWMHMCINKKPNLNEQDIINNRELLNNLWMIDCQGEIEPDFLFELFEYAAQKYGATHFFIDSLMKINLPIRDELSHQKKFINDLIEKIAVKYDGHVHLVAHPRKGDSDKSQPDKVDVSGSVNITNLAHNVLSMWRPDDEYRAKHTSSPDSVLFVKKNREWGTMGSVNLLFDSLTKSFTEQHKEMEY